MKTIKEIRDNYAIWQGYESWDIMYLNYIRTSDDKLIHHLNRVIDLIQDELKEKIVNEVYISEYETVHEQIINTGNIK